MREAGLVLKLFQLFGMFEECHHPEIDHIDHGRVTGYKQKKGNLHGVVLREIAGFDLDCREDTFSN